MKYLCMGYRNEQTWAAIDAAQRRELLEQSMAYHQQLRQQGHFLDCQALELSSGAATLRFGGQPGKVMVTDGPFAQTNEQLGGIILLEAEDLNHAIRLMSSMPCMGKTGGSIEIRPIDQEIG